MEKDARGLEESKMKVAIFWDIENMRPPKNSSVREIVGQIRREFVEGSMEAIFLVVCDVKKEPKELVDQLNEVQCQVQHVSGDKKNTSDEVLKQEMRRFVDMSSGPGKIVLISGDSDFSADLHSFRYRKGFGIVLIHNNQAKPALKQCAHYAISFSQFISNSAMTETMTPGTSVKEKTYMCKGNTEGHHFQMIPYNYTNEDWFCTEHQNSSNIGKWPYQGHFKCIFCPRRECRSCRDKFLCDKFGCIMQYMRPTRSGWRCSKPRCPLDKSIKCQDYYKCFRCNRIQCEICYIYRSYLESYDESSLDAIEESLIAWKIMST